MISRFDGAASLLPPGLQGAARFLDEEDKAGAEEIRLRTGCLPTVLLPDGEKPISNTPVTREDLNGVLEIVTGASAHAVRESMRSGYITAKGGYRVGICGYGIVRDGEVSGFKNISSAAIRITKEIKGAADRIMDELFDGKAFVSTLIISPPGRGKTTVLRDIVRQLSERGIRISVADERGEIAAMKDGEAQMDMGRTTDIMEACPKDRAVMMLLRAMNPQIIAMDEITAQEDKAALWGAANCGVSLLATAHANSFSDLYSKPLYRSMLDEGLFKRIVTISQKDARRDYRVIHVEAMECSG